MNSMTFRAPLCIYFIISLLILIGTRNVSDRSFKEHQNTHFLLNNIFAKIVPFMRYNVQEYNIARQAADENMAHAYGMLDTLG